MFYVAMAVTYLERIWTKTEWVDKCAFRHIKATYQSLAVSWFRIVHVQILSGGKEANSQRSTSLHLHSRLSTLGQVQLQTHTRKLTVATLNVSGRNTAKPLRDRNQQSGRASCRERGA